MIKVCRNPGILLMNVYVVGSLCLLYYLHCFIFFLIMNRDSEWLVFVDSLWVPNNLWENWLIFVFGMTIQAKAQIKVGIWIVLSLMTSRKKTGIPYILFWSIDVAYTWFKQNINDIDPGLITDTYFFAKNGFLWTMMMVWLNASFRYQQKKM